MKTKKVLFLPALILISLTLSAQSVSPSVVATSGGHAQGEGLTISWTLGEMVIETFQNDNNDLILTQGFHQTDIVITSVYEAKSLDIQISAFPNPVKEQLTVSVQEGAADSIQFGLIDLQGNLLLEGELEGRETNIDLATFRSGVYFLTLTIKGEQVKTFRIIKN